jgi:hypothetical protein
VKRLRLRFAGLCVVSGLAFSVNALAGPYADDMAKCLINATTPADRTVFIKWMFAAMALHPDVKSMAAVTPQQRDDLNKSAATMFQHMLLDSCRAETQAAIRYEGPQTIAYAFQIFGQAAARELLTQPDVAASLSALAKYLDESKLKALLTPAASK